MKPFRQDLKRFKRDMNRFHHAMNCFKQDMNQFSRNTSGLTGHMHRFTSEFGALLDEKIQFPKTMT